MSEPKQKIEGWLGTVITERTIVEMIERELPVDARPQFKAGDSVKVWSGRWEDHTFTIEGVRYHEGTRHHKAGFQYERHFANGSEWFWEDNLVDAKDRRGWHYDSQGYCDNPGRGY